MDKPRCLSIKSKKDPNSRCEAKATRGDFCARHNKSKIIWTSTPTPFTHKQKKAANTIYRFWISKGRRILYKSLGPATFVPEIAQNTSDLLTLQPTSTIPLVYRFSYADSKKHVWIFDVRFLIQMMHYGNELKNPYSQELFSKDIVNSFQRRVEILRTKKIPIVYVEEGELTPDQIWNEKVLDIFLKITALGYGVNVLWYENMDVLCHERFYRYLYHMWVYSLPITKEERETLVPGHSSGRTPLFKWIPSEILGKGQGLKWWRKQNLKLIAAFLTRGQEKATQGCGVLYVLTALANSHRAVREAFPWLAE